ncbi:MAG: hypothetical protein KAU20_01105 [Nanoarchaeota archaeon]|nr:hypothetical protein [Nanoarchaeota archaeon]
MKVLNISTDDYANFAHDNAGALRSVGVDCLDIKTHPHVFNYPTESQIMDAQQIRQMALQADIIQIFHSDITILNIVKDLKKRIIVYHTGTRYRIGSSHLNATFNPHVEMSIIALGEFNGLGAKNQKYLVGAVDNTNILPAAPVDSMLIIAHYPSSPKVKGTAKIQEMITEISRHHDFIWNCSTEIVPYAEQLKRIRDCDIYVELFKPQLNGRTYGSWGITALEAAAAGKIVVTQNLNHDFYLANYQDCALVICNTETDFLNNINTLLNLSSGDIRKFQERSQKWIQNYHSPEATGMQLIKILDI